MAYGKTKDLVKRTQSDKVLKDKHLKLRVIQITMVIKEDYRQWFISFLIKCLKKVVLSLINQVIN